MRREEKTDLRLGEGVRVWGLGFFWFDGGV